jgi:microcystin-dependent protein
MDPIIGSIIQIGGTYAPNGYFPCDGRLLSISEYTALFSLIGTFYGGDGITTFGVPDLRGRVPINQGAAAGGSTYTIGEVGGTEQVTLTAPNLPIHNHIATLTGSNTTANAVAANALLTSAEIYTTTGALNQVMKAGAVTTAIAGGNAPHPNMQPYLTLIYCMAYEGIYPSRP